MFLFPYDMHFNYTYKAIDPISVVICWYWIKVHNLKMIFTVRRRCHGAKLRHPHSGFMGRCFTLQCHHHLMYPNQVDSILPQYWPSITKKKTNRITWLSHDYDTYCHWCIWSVPKIGHISDCYRHTMIQYKSYICIALINTQLDSRIRFYKFNCHRCKH